MEETTYVGITLIRGFYVNGTYRHHLVGRILIIEEKKLSPEPGFEPGSPALRLGAITTKPPRRAKQKFFSYWIPHYPPEALVKYLRDGEHLSWHYFN